MSAKKRAQVKITVTASVTGRNGRFIQHIDLDHAHITHETADTDDIIRRQAAHLATGITPWLTEKDETNDA